jgi:archaellum component FlaC
VNEHLAELEKLEKNLKQVAALMEGLSEPFICHEDMRTFQSKRCPRPEFRLSEFAAQTSDD